MHFCLALRTTLNSDSIIHHIKCTTYQTTYVIKSNLSTNQIMKIFCNAANNNIDVIVVKVIDSDWNISDNDDKDLKDHKF